MLVELSIKNFAIIESANLSFEQGMTVLTGETGAGKSIIIDAIGLLVGGRGSTEFVRFGSSKAEIEGLFMVESNRHPASEKCEQLGIDLTDDMLVLRRTIAHTGKSVCRINGKLVTLSVLREIGQSLIDIHGQHEHQDLMNSERHIQFLDQYHQREIHAYLTTYEQYYKKYVELKRKIQHLNEDEKQLAHRLDLIQFQLDEISNAGLTEGEDDKLAEEKSQLVNHEKIHQALHVSYEALAAEKSGLDWVRQAMNRLEEVNHLNTPLKELYESVSNSYYLLEEASFGLRNELDHLEFDPQLLDTIETRLNEISLLKKKYGATVTEILAYAKEIEAERDKIINKEEHAHKYKQELDEVTKQVLTEAERLSHGRMQIASQLTTDIHQELRQLYMDKTTFQIDIRHQIGTNHDPVLHDKPVKLGKNGIDQVEFFISTNPGEPLKPLSKVASGGELSRIMVALKSIFSANQGITSIIFDEVDTGVSGRVAQAIAEKIYNISKGSQVLCITHLPQVAAMADTHLYISKVMKADRTKTSVTPLTGEERMNEIARMISGVEMTELTKEHAKELLELAQKMKQI